MASKVPSIPPVPNGDSQTYQFLSALKETVELLTGQRTGTSIVSTYSNTSTSSSSGSTGVVVNGGYDGTTGIESVTSLPTTQLYIGRLVYLTTDQKLYRFNGTGWVTAVAASDITGQIVASQVQDASLTTAKFAASIKPIEIVTTLPAAGTQGRVVFLTSDNKLYRDTGSAWVAAVPATDVTGQLTNAQLADIAAAKITGTLVSSQIADAAITTAKFASSLEPITLVTSVPGTLSTKTVFNTTDGKLYRWSGSAYVATVPTTDLSGTITDAQIAGMAASKVTGTLTDSQLSAIAAAKITGQLVSSQIADAAITTAKFASSIEPITVVSSVPGTLSTKTVFNSTDGKLYRWSGSAYVATVPTADLSGTVSDAQIAGMAAAKLSGSITTGQITDNAITLAKFATSIEPVTVVSSVPGTKSTNSIFNTTDSKLYRWNGTSYVATIATADLSGTISDAQVAGLSASKITGTLTDSQLSAIGAAKITGQITSTQITDNSITTAKISAGAVTAATIAANTITAAQLAAGTITATEIAAGTITTAKLAAGAVTAATIAANTITASQIAANTITSSQIAADTITAGQIAAGAITSSELATGAVVAGKIAAGTIQAADIAAGTITGDRIAANTITASQIAADTITAGQIAAGAITASELAAGAVTTAKLLVTGRGAALNDDPFTSDATAWPYNGLWTPSWSIQTVTDGVAGNTVIRTNTGIGQVYAGSRPIAFNPNKAYRVRGKLRSVGGSYTTYLVVDLRDSSGSVIGGDGTAWYYPLSGGAVPTSWTDYEGRFGYGTSRPFPTNARTMSVGALMNYGSGAGYQEAQDLRIEEMVDGSLVVDGAITAAKIAANTITASQIASDTITAANIAASAITSSELASGAVIAGKIAAGTIQAADIAAGTITGDRIAGNTITASNIAADTITAGQIAAGAVTASEIAAGAITAEKLSVYSRGDSAIVNPSFEEVSSTDSTMASGWSRFTVWGGTSTTAFRYTGNYKSGNACMCLVPGAGQAADVACTTVPVVPGETWALSMWVMSSGTNAGTSPGFYIRVRGGANYYNNNIEAYQGGGITWVTGPGENAPITPAATWVKYEVIVTIPAGMYWASPCLLNYSSNTGHTVYIDDVSFQKITTSAMIADGAITTPKLVAGAVTAGKIAANTITASEIAAGAITATQIASGTITGDRIAGNTITASNIAADTITAGQIAAGAVSTSELAANAVTAAKIAANTITANEIAANTITAGQIAAGTITASQIAGSTITGDRLVSGTITAAQIATGTITAAQMTTGTITAASGVIGSLAVGTISSAVNGSTSTGGRVVIDSGSGGRIQIYDTSNVLRVKIGFLG